MISVAEARERILAELRPTPGEVVHLAAAWGRVTAAPVTARLTQPPGDVSSMDGYAVRSADAVQHAVLNVVGSAPAGHPWPGRIGAGESLRIFTGSVMPEGTDGVLLQEDAAVAANQVTVGETVRPGQFVRRAGQDFRAGDLLIAAGKRLNARDIGLAAAANHPWLTLHRRPRVAILATGDEIALPGEPIPPGGIVSSNAHALGALVHASGGEPVVLPVVPDDRATIGAAAEAATGMDLLVTTGGASVSEQDLVQKALVERGLVVDFWKIAMRPGKPLMHGRLGSVPLIGLPGNPVSAMVCGILFMLPAIQRLTGLPGLPPPLATGVLAAPLGANDGRADHLRARLTTRADGTLVVTPYERQDSAMLRLLSEADALVLRDPHAPALAAGAPVALIRLDTIGL
jgi:molybdopterin molybdotransferase